MADEAPTYSNDNRACGKRLPLFDDQLTQQVAGSYPGELSGFDTGSCFGGRCPDANKLARQLRGLSLGLGMRDSHQAVKAELKTGLGGSLFGDVHSTLFDSVCVK
jgi:hypothetical protein